MLSLIPNGGNTVYNFPMTIEEALFIHKMLLRFRNSFHIGMGKRLSNEDEERLAKLIDALEVWIDERDEEAT